MAKKKAMKIDKLMSNEGRIVKLSGSNEKDLQKRVDLAKDRYKGD